MTEEQGDQIIELLTDMNRTLGLMQRDMIKERNLRNKDLTDIYDKLEDVVSAVDNVKSAVGGISL